MQVYSEISSNKKAILFFADCGTDNKLCAHLHHNGYDLIIFHDYTSLKFNLCPDDDKCSDSCSGECIIQHLFSRYSEIYIIGWGLGVWCASAAFDKYLIRLGNAGEFSRLKFWAKIKRVIALNGTLVPLSKTWGITPGHKIPWYTQNEFAAIEDNLFFSNSLTWDTAIISSSDQIFNTQRQKLFWENYSYIAPGGVIPGTRRKFNLKIVDIEGDHNIFNKFSCWDEIIAL